MPDNYGLAEIKNLKDAKDAWESFFGRFFSSQIPLDVNVSFDPKLHQFKPREMKAAKYKHPGFRIKDSQELPLDKSRTFHSDDFDDFLNGNTVTIPENIILNEKVLGEVEQAIQEGIFENELLKKEEYPFYALWLFKQNKITRQQMSTILTRAQIPEEYPITETFRIFDDTFQFTEEAHKLLLPAIINSTFGGKFTEEHLKRFRLLMIAAPKSEQIFYISKLNPQIVVPVGRELGNALYRNNSWYTTFYNDQQHDIHFSFGIIEALQIAKHGIHGAAASRAKLGKVGIDEVKEGVEFYYRPTAISMPNSGIAATTKGIHGYEDSPMPAVTAHDVFHSKLHSTIRPEFNMMLNHMNQIIFKHTKQKWSKTMWELVDREFHSFQYRKINDLNPKTGAILFMEMLHRDGKDPSFLFNSLEPPQLSDDGFALVWNMLNQPDVWKNLYKVDIDYLPYPYNLLLQKMKVFKTEVGSDHTHSEILTLKYHFFNVTTPTEFKKICNLLDLYGDKLITGKDEKLVFGKYSIGNDKNLTVLKFKGSDKEILINDTTVRRLIPVCVNLYLESKFGEKNNEAVQNELKNISREFKSTYSNSRFSKELLDSSVKNLSSITAQLDFLERCYEEIVPSKGYTRRHATLDNLLFFKNPLTSSQRQHIVLLKEKLDEIISQYHEENFSSKEDITELQWFMKNRGSNLLLCNTNRFSLNPDSTAPSSKK